MTKPNKYRYNVITDKGREEPYSGTFNSWAEAMEWYKTHGKWHESMGKTLIRRKVGEEVNVHYAM